MNIKDETYWEIDRILNMRVSEREKEFIPWYEWRKIDVTSVFRISELTPINDTIKERVDSYER